MSGTQDASAPGPAGPGSPGLGADVERQRDRLLALRAQLARERGAAISPAIARALEMAETYLFLGLGYVGHTDELFPGEGTVGSAGR